LSSPHLITPRFQRNYPYQPNTNQQSENLASGTATHLIEPMIGMFGEMIYSRMFDNSVMNMYSYPNSYHLAGSASSGFRRHVMLADKSLGRIWVFLFCWVMLCLVLF
jgi:E3 ubiquitin-protein ligase RNF5